MVYVKMVNSIAQLKNLKFCPLFDCTRRFVQRVASRYCITYVSRLIFLSGRQKR